MAAPLSYMKFTRGTTSFTVPTMWGSGVSANGGMLATAAEGLFTYGENRAEAQDRTYSNGSVLPPAAVYSGREFSVDVTLFSRNGEYNVKSNLKSFHDFLVGGELTFETDYPHNLTCMVERVDVSQADWAGTSRVVLQITLKAAEA